MRSLEFVRSSVSLYVCVCMIGPTHKVADRFGRNITGRHEHEKPTQLLRYPVHRNHTYLRTVVLPSTYYHRYAPYREPTKLFIFTRYDVNTGARSRD